MLQNCTQLINRILAGDEGAFACLVQRYQKRVHALAWRKTGDYQIAEEITQDTFLQVYQKLSTLRNPKQFDGWLYVITNRLCINWIQRHKSEIQSIEDIPAEEMANSSYVQHRSEVREKENIANYQEIVKKLLEKLPESERTVVTLYYMGEMTAKEIGKFLGVSVNTIKSRLHRARNRLKEDEPMIREAISNYQISPMLTENILRNVSELKPTTTPGSKPLIPWVLGTTAAFVLLLMIGTGNRNITRVQQSYSLDSESEIAVDIIEAQFVEDRPVNVDTKKQIGIQTNVGKTDGNIGTGSIKKHGSQGNHTRWSLPEDATLRIAKGRTNDIEFSIDGNLFAVATPIGIWVYDAKTGKELSLLQKPGQDITTLAFSPDSKLIAAASRNRWGGEIQFWDVKTQTLLTTTEAQQGITTLFYSADGSKLASTGNFGHVGIWDISNSLDPQVIRQVRLDQIESWGQSQLAELSPDMRFLAVTDEDWKNKNFPIYLFDASNGKLIHTLTGHTRWIKSIAFSPDSKLLISGDEYEAIRIWNTDSGKAVSEMYWQQGSSTYSLLTSPQGKFLASGHRDSIKLWNNTNKQQKYIETLENYQQCLKIADHKDYVYKFSFSPDEKILLSASKDGTIRGWDTTSGEEQFACDGHLERINGLILSETGDTLTTFNRPINPPGVFQRRTWNTETGNLLSTDFIQGFRVTTMGMSQDNKLLAVHDTGGKCLLRNIETDSFDIISKFTLEGVPRSCLNVRFAFSQDSKMLAAGGEDGSVHVWKINEKKQSFIGRLSSGFKKMQLMFKVNGHSEYIRTLAFSPDGKTLATGGRDKIIQLWNVSDGTLLFTLTGHQYRVDTLAFSPDGKILASGNEKLHLWDVETGIELKRIPSDRRISIGALLYSPDGNNIIMGGSDGINLYDTRSGIISNIHLGSTYTLKFSSDGNTLMSVENSGSVLFWDWEEIDPIP